MNLDTVWLFPHAVKGFLVFQGSLDTREDDAADVLHLLLAAERLGEDRGIPHYQDILAKRLDKEKGAAYALRDHDLLPPFSDEGTAGVENEDLALVEIEGLLGKNLRKKAEAEIMATLG